MWYIDVAGVVCLIVVVIDSIALIGVACMIVVEQAKSFVYDEDFQVPMILDKLDDCVGFGIYDASTSWFFLFVITCVVVAGSFGLCLLWLPTMISLLIFALLVMLREKVREGKK